MGANTQQEVMNYVSREETDILVYAGGIERRGYEAICKALEGTRRKNVLLVLCTFGGDPHAGYRIARSLHHHYGKDGQISILVPERCKSAGTLICIGAHQLVIADEGELGPLDVQVAKPDEMFASGSGLDIMRGLSNLRMGVLASFKEYLLDINAGSGVSTKMAAEVATRLAVGTYEPIFAQIDPIRLGEMEAALSIANAYGKRLAEKSKNLKPNALGKLVNSYPSHSFVIDRKEARDLFEKVRQPDPIETTIGELVKKSIWRNGSASQSTPQVLDLASVLQSSSSSAPKSAEQKSPSQGNSNEPKPASTPRVKRNARKSDGSSI